MANRSEGSIRLGLSDYAIPEAQTTYHEECFSSNYLMQEGFFSEKSSTKFVVGYEFFIDPITIKYMHHIVVYGLYGGCFSSAFAKRVPVFAWTSGEEFLYFPNDTGMKFDSMNGIRSFIIQYHVENSDRDSGKVDSGSGIRLYFSSTSVSHEIGMMNIGDPSVSLRGSNVGQGLTSYIFECPSSCTQNYLHQDITIVRESLHMHSHGERIVNQVHRDGEIVHESYVDYWDFDQTGTPAPQNEPFNVKRGDSFKTICYYNSESDVKFGLGSDDEMCMVFILYFPKQDLEFCDLSFQGDCRSQYKGMSFLDSVDDLRRMFGNSAASVSPTLTPTNSAVTSSNEPTFLPSIVLSTESPAGMSPSAIPRTLEPTQQISSLPSALEQTNDPTLSSSCNDSTLRFRINYKGRTIFRDCIWVANKATVNRCRIDGIESICPLTCGACSSCVDTSIRFKVTWIGRKLSRDCIWVSNRATSMRCKVAGVANSCRSTCGSC